MTETALQVRASESPAVSGGRRQFLVVAILALGSVMLFPSGAQATTAVPAGQDTIPLAEEDARRSGDRLAHFVWMRQSADDALRQGFPSLAVRLYWRAAEVLPEDDYRHNEIDLMVSTALLAMGRYDEARELLEEYRGEVNDEVLLRRAILSWRGQRWDELEYRLSEISSGAISRRNIGWYSFLQGQLKEVEGDAGEAEKWFRRAEEEAVSPAQRAQFVLARFRLKLLDEEPDDALLDSLKEEMEAYEGTEDGYRFAQKYVIALDSLDRRNEAIEVVRSKLQMIPEMEKELRDQFLLLEGVIGGRDSEAGVEAFEKLLRTGDTRRYQRAALYELGRDLSDGAVQDRFKELLSELIDAEAEHPLIDELLTFRSRISFERRDFEEASEDAETVLSQYPGSRFKKDALRLLAHIAWEERKFRTAADYVTRLRAEIPEGERRSELGVLIADCYFRAQDYNNAADAYGNVLREQPERISRGLLVFQRVQAELRGGRLDRAREHLDDAAFETLEDLDFLWQAEWNLLKIMQRKGRMEEAYGRVTELLEDREDYPLPHALRVRFTWLQAQLSFEAGRPEDTLSLVEMVFSELARDDAGSDLTETLRRSVRSYAMLMQSQALLETGEAEEAVRILQELREEDRAGEPAVYSYLVEARYHAAAGQPVEAQRLLNSLADSYENSPYAPIALYEAAVITDRGGLGDGYQERAISRLEQLVESYPDHPLAFYARLKQADFLREMNRFGTARRIYESLENRHPDHPDWFRVKVALADTHLAQGEGGDESFLERALVTLERLYDLPNLTPDMRAEAGFKYGFAYEKIGDKEQAQEVYWLVISSSLQDDNNLSELGSKGRYWVARSVLHLGRLLEDSERWGEAREAYALIPAYQLPGEGLARSRISPLTAR